MKFTNSYMNRLFKKTSTGAIQFWDISFSNDSHEGQEVGVIQTTYGQLGTELPQVTTEVLRHGKNHGKKNETTPFQQAEKEAFARWEKQKKKGYVETLEAAQGDKTDDIIEGGILPMLAHSYAKQAHKIKYPAFFQPKLDGIRCIAIIEDGEATLWSRTRKQITSAPHIIAELEAAFPTGSMILDGELYNHDYKHNFEKIVSLVRQEVPAEDHELIQYHVYDVASAGTFKERWNRLVDLFVHYEGAFTSIFLVQTGELQSEDKVMELFEVALSKGMEGLMLRNADGLYANKRSYDLQKVKEFDDAEFSIVGVEEGRGKLAGHAIFVCQTEAGKQFLAKMKGDTARLKMFFDDHSLWQGKKLTVQYQGLTGAEKVPRFPVGIAIRDYE